MDNDKQKPNCWTCIYCGFHHFNSEIDFGEVACRCGRGRGRWTVDYVERVEGEAAPAPQAATPKFYGKDCPEGMVQVEFVGCDPKEMYSKYGWKPTKHTFLEIYVDGQRFRIDVGDFHDGRAQRRGLHIVTDGLNLACEKTGMNAASVWMADSQAEAPRPQTVQEPQRRNAMEFSLEQAQSLLKMFGGEEAAITVTTGPDGSLLAYHTDYPEEGSVDL